MIFLVCRLNSSLFIKLNYNVINQGSSYWPSNGSDVCRIGPRPWANTADRGPVTGPRGNYLINDNFINQLNVELSIETRLPCLYGFEKKQVMTSSLLAETYWPSCVSIGRVALYRPSLSLIRFGQLLPYTYCITNN